MLISASDDASASLFEQCFKALEGVAPYAWQRRLYGELMRGARYDALDLPTGLGKTSVITIWLIARAAGATLPRRLVYVVDRRAVVDQATDVANRLAEALKPGATGVLEELREKLALRGGAELPVSTLRGQHLDNRRWMDDPAGPAIVVGTVDMVGSRLLFEGYGVSRGMRPAHAGLLGADSLIVLDETHLVPPFEALVQQAAAMDRPTPVPAMHVMSLSATGRDQAGDVFRLDLGDGSEDRADEQAMKRLYATKRLWLMGDAGPKDIAARLADQAWSFGEGGRRVIVFCNSRTTAQKVEETLRARRKKEKALQDVQITALLVGERRYRERERLRGDGTADNPGDPVFLRFFPGPDMAAAAAKGRPAFLIATSAGEVGVDLDADDLVCDLVAWERMVQRFGRVNRRTLREGEKPGEARIAAIPVADDKEAEDEIKAERLAVLKTPFTSPHWPAAPAQTAASPPAPEGAVGDPKDASPGALSALKENDALRDALSNATTPEPLRPPLTRPTLDAWSLTSLERHPGRPKVEPWLRGWIDKEPQTTVLWRRIFPLRPGEERVTKDLEDFFEAAPPHMSETLEAPNWRVSKLLIDRAKAYLKRSTKGEDEAAPPGEEPAADDSGDAAEESQNERGRDGPAGREFRPDHAAVVVLLAADRTVRDMFTAQRLAAIKSAQLDRELAGRTVVIDARLGGLDENGLLDAKEPAKAGGRLPVTIDASDPAQWGLDLQRSGRRVSFGQKPSKEKSKGGRWRLDPFRWASSDADDAPAIWIETWRGEGGDKPGDPAVSRHEQTLDDHHAWAERHARRIATTLNSGAVATELKLSPAQVEMLAAVAKIHDRGKDRDRWQNAMGAPKDRRPLAKTAGGGNGRLLDGYRHEFGTLAELARGAIRLPNEVDGDPELRDLALHLIAAHHGHARPVIAPIDPDPEGPPPSDLGPLAREAALRFERLQRRWGPWGLAWWEALLRAADWSASRANDERDEAAHG